MTRSEVDRQRLIRSISGTWDEEKKLTDILSSLNYDQLFRLNEAFWSAYFDGQASCNDYDDYPGKW